MMKNPRCRKIHNGENKWCFKILTSLNSYDAIRSNYYRTIFNAIGVSEGNRIEYPVSKIVDGIWLGSVESAVDKCIYYNNDIRHVLCILHEPLKVNGINIRYTYIQMRDKDACDSNPMHLLDIGANAIHDALSSGQNILVHCKRGHHRSASIVAFYLMKYRSVPLLDAIKLIKKARPTTFRKLTCILPYLIEYELQNRWSQIKRAHQFY